MAELKRKDLIYTEGNENICKKCRTNDKPTDLEIKNCTPNEEIENKKGGLQQEERELFSSSCHDLEGFASVKSGIRKEENDKERAILDVEKEPKDESNFFPFSCLPTEVKLIILSKVMPFHHLQKLKKVSNEFWTTINSEYFSLLMDSKYFGSGITKGMKTYQASVIKKFRSLSYRLFPFRIEVNTQLCIGRKYRGLSRWLVQKEEPEFFRLDLDDQTYSTRAYKELLRWSAQKGHTKFFRDICNKSGIDINKITLFLEKDESVKVPLLYISVKKGHLETCKAMVNEFSADVNGTKPDECHTPLSLAVKNGHKDIVEFLLKKGADINAKHGYRSETLLILAARKGNTDMASFLISKGIDVGAENTWCETALDLAANNGHAQVCKVLVKEGKVDPDRIYPRRQTCNLYRAAFRGDMETAKALLECGATVDLTFPSGFSTPAEAACKNNNLAMMKLLHEHGCDLKYKQHSVGKSLLSVNVDVVEEIDKRPLYNAKLLEWLLEQDLDPNISHWVTRRTPLHLAAAMGYLEHVHVLLCNKKIRTEPNPIDNNGDTPLHLASENGRFHVVEYLINRKDIQIDLVNNEGRTPLALAIEKGRHRVVNLLVSKGVTVPDHLQNKVASLLIEYKILMSL